MNQPPPNQNQPSDQPADQPAPPPKQTLTSLSAPYQPGANWADVHEDALDLPTPRGGRADGSGKGPRSLVAMCLRVLAENVLGATAEALEVVPEGLLGRLWREAYLRNMPFNTWKLLTTTLLPALDPGPDGDVDPQRSSVTLIMAMVRYCQEIVNPPCELDVYLEPLRDLGSGLVYLCIDNVSRFRPHELIPLAQLPHLAVLELIDREPGWSWIDDRLIGNWDATGDNAFANLRILKIMSATHMVTETGLGLVMGFPRLEIFDLTVRPAPGTLPGKRRELENPYGWRITKPHGSLFVSYASAYFSRHIGVNKLGVGGLVTTFEDDRQEITWGRCDHHGEPEEGIRIDCRWHAIIGGYFKFPQIWTGGKGVYTPVAEVPENEFFWFLALLDGQSKNHYDATATPRARKQAAGVALPDERFVHLKLRTVPPENGWTDDRTLAQLDRLIFSRGWRSPVSEPATATTTTRPQENATRRQPDPSWTARAEDRKELGLRPRKQQKVGDLLSSFGTG
ncbi:hypothetical protein B0J18DRAFT_373104 [Chaetomium sp. MPI-SDFR-AT-0129]|nr:hypothetical protein B0J18DRAFT_373104 [Chaetomium sp. MPI-SDFR-AT-0129]